MRIIKISRKYKERPSSVLGIDDNTLAFLFDEAVDYILSNRGTREIEKNNKRYIEEYWIKEPNWSDKEELKSNNKPKNNSSLINEMKENLKKYK